MPPPPTFNCFGKRTDMNRGGSHDETPGQPPCLKVVATLLEDVWLHMEEGHHQNGSHQPPIHTGIAHARYPDKGAAAAVGGWCWTEPTPVGKREKNTPWDVVLLIIIIFLLRLPQRRGKVTTPPQISQQIYTHHTNAQKSTSRPRGYSNNITTMHYIYI